MLGFDSSLPGGPLFSNEEHDGQTQAETGWQDGFDKTIEGGPRMRANLD